jgi:hypothetical protein
VTLLAALWLALLHALAPAALPQRPSIVARERPAVIVALRAETPGETVRAERTVARVVVARVVEPAPHAPPRPPIVAPTGPAPECRAARPPPRGCARSHAVAARGGVRPYFPTAPPLQG